jgi:hypothetical protein
VVFYVKKPYKQLREHISEDTVRPFSEKGTNDNVGQSIGYLVGQ